MLPVWDVYDIHFGVVYDIEMREKLQNNVKDNEQSTDRNDTLQRLTSESDDQHSDQQCHEKSSLSSSAAALLSP